MIVGQFIADLISRGRYCFSTEEAARGLGTGTVATRAALRRLRQKGELAVPYRGFYVIVPSEYRSVCFVKGKYPKKSSKNTHEPAGIFS